MALLIVNPVARLADDKHEAYYQAEDGSWTKASITKSQYASLARKGAGEPKPRPVLPTGKKWIWRYALEGLPVFDTASGSLNPGDYYPGDSKLPPVYCPAKGKIVTFDKPPLLRGKVLTISKDNSAVIKAVIARPMSAIPMSIA